MHKVSVTGNFHNKFYYLSIQNAVECKIEVTATFGDSNEQGGKILIKKPETMEELQARLKIER
jgi:hypothetical protein